MGTIRLGKRTHGRSAQIEEFVPLAPDLVFTGWDMFEGEINAAAAKDGVLDPDLPDRVTAIGTTATVETSLPETPSARVRRQILAHLGAQ